MNSNSNTIDFKKLDYLIFKYDEKFWDIDNLIYKKFETFFRKLRYLSKNKKALDNSKQSLYEFISYQIYKKIENNPLLIEIIESIVGSKKNYVDDQSKVLISKINTKIFLPIINETFEISDLILSAFEESDKEYKAKFKKLMKDHEPILDRFNIMTGKKLTPEKKEFYDEIIDKQQELIKKYQHTNPQKASLSNAIRILHPDFSDRKVKTTVDSIAHHRRQGNLIR